MSGSAIRTLIAGAIDYAGLFPPAALPMDDALRSYATYLDSADSWALGRFVVPESRIEELRDCATAARAAGRGSPPLRLSVICAPGKAAERRCGGEVDLRGMAVREAMELRASTREDILQSAPLPADVDVFFEIPIESDPGALIEAIKQIGAKAKVRTGGVTADAFPSAANLARFLVACARIGVAFKATAGLHHPLRARYRLTYDPDSPSGEMFGFLNVFLAAAFARAGLREEQIAELLIDGDASAIRLGPSGIEWRGQLVSNSDLARTRATLALSFGSCSFREPVDELAALGLL